MYPSLRCIAQYVVVLSLLVFSSEIFAQGGKRFSNAEKLYVRGSSVLIGNNSMGNDAKAAFEDVNIPNDIEKMQYIDVDRDGETFSSSSATIRNGTLGHKVAYAALYWSGLYPYESAVMRESGRKMVYKGKGERDSLVAQIKLKIPGSKKYKSVKGEVLFDSYKTPAFANNKPYVCFKDVTNLLQSQDAIDGEYTVANVRGTKGFISGGAAAGWLLYIIYEDDTQSPKYFSTFDGLVEVSKKAVEVTFDEFKSVENGTGDAEIILATLEGDNKLKTDDCSVFSEAENTYVSLGNSVRAPKNFFNSSITFYDQLFMDRNPASTNTLGFDLLKYKLPSGTISSTTESTSLRFQAKADRFYLFFAAFETAIPDALLAEKRQGEPTEKPIANSEKEQEPDDEVKISEATVTEIIPETIVQQTTEIGSTKISEVTPPNTSVETPTKEEIAAPMEQAETVVVVAKEVPTIVEKEEVETSMTVSEQVVETTPVNETTIEKTTNPIAIINQRPSIEAKGMIQGYYLVTNVFGDKRNATAWKEYLNAEGYNARTFENSETGFTSVYIESSTDPKVMQKRKEILKQIPYLSDIWVARLNFE